MKSSIIYHSVTGKTKRMAEIIAQAMTNQGVESKAFSIDEIDEAWVNDSKCVIFGSPTYCADMSATSKMFLETFGKYGVSGKLSGAFATADFVHGGSELAVQSILTHLMFFGMLVYSGGAMHGAPPIHLGPTGISGQLDNLEGNFVVYGERMAAKTKELWG